jgi:hypothetical protein
VEHTIRKLKILAFFIHTDVAQKTPIVRIMRHNPYHKKMAKLLKRMDLWFQQTIARHWQYNTQLDKGGGIREMLEVKRTNFILKT